MLRGIKAEDIVTICSNNIMYTKICVCVCAHICPHRDKQIGKWKQVQESNIPCLEVTDSRIFTIL